MSLLLLINVKKIQTNERFRFQIVPNRLFYTALIIYYRHQLRPKMSLF